jgi:hypothetical protein
VQRRGRVGAAAAAAAAAAPRTCSPAALAAPWCSRNGTALMARSRSRSWWLKGVCVWGGGGGGVRVCAGHLRLAWQQAAGPAGSEQQAWRAARQPPHLGSACCLR